MPESLTPSYHALRISVVMPVYNAAPFLAEALKSIQDQTLPLAEVILVDDGSTDGSAELAETFPFVTLIRKPHGGICETLNRGLEAASGEFLSFLDADDRWLPEKTARQMASFQADPSLDMVFGHSRRFLTQEKNGVRSETTIDIIPGLGKTCMLIKRASFEKAGRFPSSEERHDFMSWYFRAKESHLRSLMLPEVVLERRIHQNNHGVLKKNEQRRTYFMTLKENLERRRAAQASSQVTSLT